MIATTKIGAGGRIVLPAELRRALGARIGDEVVLQLDDAEVRLFTVRQAIARAQRIVRQYVPEGRSLAQELIDERRAASTRE